MYNDNVNDPRIKKWLGEVVGSEGEDLSRHDKWLCMMYPRLKLLHRLLAEDGVIFISIDDNEYVNLKIICDEIFGSNCFISNISQQRTYSTRNDSKGIVNEVENILVYSKVQGWQPNKLPRTEKMNSTYKNPDNDIKPWASDNPCAPGAVTHQGIPEEQIAIKTSKVNDLGKTNLMSRDCPIRYIITVNALKEGWDCPLAYILASLANKTSKVDVEQILGRILRQPYTRKHGNKLLNTSFVLTCFYDLIERDRVFTDATYTFPMVITPSESTDKVPKSLYEAEWDKMNNFERRTLDVIAGCEGVLWWHRIIEKKGFHINGFINHYPDFMVMMKSGRIVLVEAKGDDRDNGDSRTKLKLGKAWASQAGRMFKYYMTFDQNSIEGAYNLEDFAEVLRDL